MSGLGLGRSAWLAVALGLGIVLMVRLLGAYAGEPAEPGHRLARPLPGDGPVRIVALGTSLTRNGRWPDQLADALRACSGRELSITRIARAGANSDWGVTQIERVVAERPDILLIEFAINDADVIDGVSLARSEKNHRTMIERLRAELPEARPVLMTTSPAQGMRGLIRPWLARYYAEYRRLAADYGVGLVDLAPVWAAAVTGGRGAALLPDGLHPTEAAVTRVALPVLVSQLGMLHAGCGPA